MIITDLKANVLVFENKAYSLDDFRTYLLTYWEPLCRKHYLRTTHYKNSTIFCFDWNYVFSVAIDYYLPVEEFTRKYQTINHV